MEVRGIATRGSHANRREGRCRTHRRTRPSAIRPAFGPCGRAAAGRRAAARDRRRPRVRRAGRDVDRLDRRPQALLLAGARRRRDAADVRGVRVGVVLRATATWSTATSRSTSSRITCRRAASRGSTRSARCWSVCSARCSRGARRPARSRSTKSGETSAILGLAGVDRAGADGAGLRAARRSPASTCSRLASARCGRAASAIGERSRR